MPINHFELITIKELQDSDWWDPDEEDEDYLKQSNLSECISLASTVINYLSGGDIKRDWATLNNQDNEQSIATQDIKEACEKQTLFLARNGVEIRNALSDSISTGSLSFNSSLPQDQNYVVKEVWMLLREAGYLSTERQVDMVSGDQGVGNASSIVGGIGNIHQDNPGTSTIDELDTRYVARGATGIGSQDATILVNQSGSTGRQVDLSINFSNPVVADKLKEAIKNDPNLSKALKGDKGNTGASIKNIEWNVVEEPGSNKAYIEYTVLLDNGDKFTGQSNVFTLPQGPKGDKGDKGDTGTVENIDDIDLSTNKTIKPLMKQVGDNTTNIANKLDSSDFKSSNLRVDVLEFSDDNPDTSAEMSVSDWAYSKQGQSGTNKKLRDLANAAKDEADNNKTELSKKMNSYDFEHNTFSEDYFMPVGAEPSNFIGVLNFHNDNLTTDSKLGVGAINEVNAKAKVLDNTTDVEIYDDDEKLVFQGKWINK